MINVSPYNKSLFILELPTLSKLLEMIKTVRVHHASPSGTEAATRSQISDTGRPVDTQKPYLLKLLIGLCIGQLITMVTTSTVLGSFVISHVSHSYRKIHHFLCKASIILKSFYSVQQLNIAVFLSFLTASFHG